VGVASSLLVIGALWNADLVRFNKWGEPKTAGPAAPKPAASAPLKIPNVSRDVAHAPPALSGTDSSISPQPHALILSGVIPGRNAREGNAMIGTSRENPQTYSAGAVLVNGARLTEIHEKYVVLERAGKSERLYLQGLSAEKVETRLSEILSVGGTKPPPMAKATNSEPITDYLRPSPVYDGATLRGFEIYAGRNATPFGRMGLKSGDIITSLEGTPLSNPAQAFELFGQLMDGVALSATLIRQGKIESVTLDGALIIAERDRNSGQSLVFQTTPH
jgi:general secretion pathway protein C